MNRLPSLLRSTPPSPRTPSVTRMPRTLGGQTMPVGWNCTISMSIRSAPASRPMLMPSPVYSQALERAFHEHADALMLGVLLERADHLQAGAVPDVGEAGVAMAAEVPLEDE